MDIVFDGALEHLGFFEPREGEARLVTRGAGGTGFGLELGEDALLGVDEDDAFSELSLRGTQGGSELLRLLAEATGDPQPAGPEREGRATEVAVAELAEAEWPVEKELLWRREGSALIVSIAGARRSQWARLGAGPLYVALDLETPGEAYVAALVFTALVEDPGFALYDAAAGD